MTDIWTAEESNPNAIQGRYGTEYSSYREFTQGINGKEPYPQFGSGGYKQSEQHEEYPYEYDYDDDDDDLDF